MTGKIKFLVSIIFLGVLASSAWSQETISPENAVRFIGKWKTVCGNVTHAYYSPETKGQPTILHFSNNNPKVFVVLIWGSDRDKFNYLPESLLSNNICVSGVIQSYLGGPDIFVTDPSQISINSLPSSGPLPYEEDENQK
ncbi:MAG TPA: DNA-binding protein [Thermodesulfobacteriota bacterium]|nr:DNA-binding protein [Thermodesulfobacteriota bacterium]